MRARTVSELERDSGGARGHVQHPSRRAGHDVIHHRRAPPAVLPERQPLGQAVIAGRQVREQALREPVAVAGDARAHRSPKVTMARTVCEESDLGGRQSSVRPLGTV